VTVDCAITAVEEVAAASELGMRVLVTDHHAPRADGALPAAPSCTPRWCGYPCRELCATAGRIQASGRPLLATGRDASELCETVDLVGLATVA